MRTNASVSSAARSAVVNTNAALPSVIGQKSYSRRGSATIGLASTSSTVTADRNWARSLASPWRWFLTATSASRSRATLCSSRYSRAVIPANEGRVIPCLYSAGWVIEAMISVAAAVERWVIFSPPTSSVSSLAPDAIDCQAA